MEAKRIVANPFEENLVKSERVKVSLKDLFGE
jgi:hypothetical protein